MRQSKIYNYSDEDFIKILYESNSIRDCRIKLGLGYNGANGSNQIKGRCLSLGLDLKNIITSEKSHQTGATKTQKPIEFYLTEKSYCNNAHLRDRLIREQLLDYKCAICGNEGIWNDCELQLQLDHINGIHTDNRIENLRLLCPNCHSQTETYAGKNLRLLRAKSDDNL